MKFLGITLYSKFTFQRHFEEILGRYNTRYHRIRLLVNKKWGPSPSTILEIYKRCVRPIFEIGSLSTITTSGTIISKIQRLQNKSPCVYQNTSTWDRFSTPLSVIRPVSLQITLTYRGNFSKHPIAPETGSPAYIRTRLAQYSDLELTSQHGLLCQCVFLEMPHASHKQLGH